MQIAGLFPEIIFEILPSKAGFLIFTTNKITEVNKHNKP